jgi:hypothetical protein
MMTAWPVRTIAWISVLAGILLLLWPIAPDTPLWEQPGAGNPAILLDEDVVTPIGALIGGDPIGDGGDRLQLGMGLLLLGAGLGALVASGSRRLPPNGPAPRIERHGFHQP